MIKLEGSQLCFVVVMYNHQHVSDRRRQLKAMFFFALRLNCVLLTIGGFVKATNVEGKLKTSVRWGDKKLKISFVLYKKALIACIKLASFHLALIYASPFRRSPSFFPSLFLSQLQNF